VILAQGDVITPEDLSERIWKETMAIEKVGGDYQDDVITSVQAYANKLPTDVMDTITSMPTVSHRPTDSGSSHDFRWRVRRFEAELIRKELQATGCNRPVAAEALGLSVRSLSQKLNAYGLGGGPPFSLPPAPVQDQKLWADLKPAPSSTFKEKVQQFESALLINALESASWNKSSAARLLKMPLRTLMFKIKAYRIKRS
jgi:DNA-binding NtrC family response regulator